MVNLFFLSFFLYFFCSNDFSLRRTHLQLVVVLGQVRHLDRGAALTLADGLDELTKLVVRVEGVTVHEGPVVEHTLREGLARGGSAEVGDETEGLEHRQVGVEVVDRGARALVLGEDVATLLVQARVDASKAEAAKTEAAKDLCGLRRDMPANVPPQEILDE